ncbi:MAG: 1-pyrroline-5-carboxylate dehydrogenase [Bacteroidetes bacterium QS_8_68_15]|nr:MAG: 1-pyrroline-5-carboxylate dehydrogenase [Bacteroidetes bacterium QS_8_68_15]
MNNSIARTPPPENEPVRSYAPGSAERASLQARLAEMKQDAPVEIPALIGGEEVRTGETTELHAPHEHRRVLAQVHHADSETTKRAIEAALEARHEWMQMPWTERAAVFLRAADLLAGPWRDTINAASMLGQSKNAHQAEIDAACEFIDFIRFNVHYMRQIYADQPRSSDGVWNRMQYRPLEGFVLAITPFNFTSIQGNLPTAPALMGNVALWKPSLTSTYSAYYTYRLFEEAGLPPGVLNVLPGEGAPVGDTALASEHFAGLHFTGSTATFEHLWREIGQNISHYNTYPRIVGETGGKDFIVAHASADPDEVATAIVRGSFEFQGQKCSAASRMYLPRSLWPDIEASLNRQLGELSVGPPEDFTHFINAVIDEDAFEKITGYIDHARRDDAAEIVFGGDYDDTEGYFIEPTVVNVDDPQYRAMQEEIFGPVAPVYVYDDDDFSSVLDLVDETSPYGLTGAIFGYDRAAVDEAQERLSGAAGNFYINDKPTGAVVGQQPFGGARKSGTNDKAGSKMNLMRWASPRAIKENLNPPSHYGYAFHQPDGECDA